MYCYKTKYVISENLKTLGREVRYPESIHIQTVIAFSSPGTVLALAICMENIGTRFI